MPDPIVPPVPPTPPAPWYTGKITDAETIGHMQSHGWHEKTPEEVAIAAVTAHREAQKFIGVPQQQLIRLPKDANDTAGWKQVHERLGAPADPKEYDAAFATVKDAAGNVLGTKGADGKTIGERTLNLAKSFAERFHLTKDAATALAQDMVKDNDTFSATEKTEHEAKLLAERTDLAKNWGPNKDANMIVAKNAAVALGMKPEEVNALESVVGYARTMEMLRLVGSKIGEDKFVQGDNKQGVMTQQQAVARKAELMQDASWSKRLLEGDVATVREWTALETLISGDAMAA